MNSVWSNEDPREHYSYTNKQKIVIFRPDVRLGVGWIDTKNGYSIFTDFEDHRSIDKWDPDWL